MKTLRSTTVRKGGEVGGGIMTGVMRENYDEGTPDLQKELQKSS